MTIGKIKFYDYRKNHFGYITEVSIEGINDSSDIYFSVNDLNCGEVELFDGAKVAFEIIKDGIKKRATNVKLISQLSDIEKLGLIKNLAGFELEKLVYYLIGKKVEIPFILKKYICETILTNPPFRTQTYSWEIIKEIDTGDFTKKYVDLILQQDDSTKLYFVKSDKELIIEIANNWNFENVYTTKLMIESIIKNKISQGSLNKFIDLFYANYKSNSLENVFIFFSHFFDADQVSNYLKNIDLTKFSTYQMIATYLKSYFTEEKSTFIYKQLSEIIDIDDELFEFKVKGHLLRTLILDYNLSKYKDKIVFAINKSKLKNKTDFELAIELSLLTNYEESINLLSIKYKEVSNDISYSDRFELLQAAEGDFLKAILESWRNTTEQENTRFIEKVMIDGKYIPFSDSIKDIVHKQLPLHAKDNSKNTTYFDTYTLNKYFLFSIEFYDLTLLKSLIEFNIFRNETALVNNIKIFDDKKITPVVRLLLENEKDNRLEQKTKVLYMLAKDHYIPENDIIETFISEEKPFIQSLILKKLIYLVYQKVINEARLLQILNFNCWTSISCLLIIKFIQSKPQNKDQALSALSLTYKEHFNIMNQFVDQIDSFEDLFSIRRVSKMCNGRKHYDLKKWEKDLLVRTYTNKDNLLIGDKLNLFCEGRYWKMVEYWDSSTKSPFKVPVYWCRGGTCYQLNHKSKKELTYLEWTLPEIADVFSIKLDDLIYSSIGGWANRMNEISERLICRNCKSILRPLPFDPKQLGFYATPLFNCVNSNCSEQNKKIRFTHCLNSKCNKVLDSRDLPTCENGWLLCECGTCCPEHSGRDYEPIYVEPN